MDLDVDASRITTYQSNFRLYSSQQHDNLAKYQEVRAPSTSNITARLEPKDVVGNMADMYRTGALDSIDAIRVMWELASALEYVHRYNVLHGRLRLENVYLAGSRPSYSVRLFGYGFTLWLPSDQTPSKAGDVLALGRIFCHIATRGAWDGQSPLQAKDLTAIKTDKLRPWALRFLQAATDADEARRPSSLLLSYHPFLVLNNETCRNQFGEAPIYDEQLDHFTVDNMRKWMVELDPEVKNDIPQTENIGAAETTIDTFWRDTSKLGSMVIQGCQMAPHYFSEFFYHSIKLGFKQPILTLEGARSYYFSNALLGTWNTSDGISKRVAIKRGKWGGADETADLKNRRFAEEILKLTQLDHLFVAKFYGSFTHQGFKNIMMEVYDGSLKQYSHRMIDEINRGSVENQLILGQLVNGLCYLHGQNIVHKDIRPDSILMWRSPRKVVFVKISNIGLSRPQPQDKSEWNMSTTIGYKGYLAPELIAAGEKKTVHTTASDLWALGVVIYFVVTRGEHPFNNRNPTVADECRDELIQSAKKLRNVSKISVYWDVGDLIYRLLDPQPANRPDVSTLLSHPYFALSNSTCTRYFAQKMSQLATSQLPSFGHALQLRAKDMRAWYDRYDNTFKTDPDGMQLDELDKLDTRSLDYANLYRNILTCPKIFGLYLWSTLLDLKLPVEEYRNIFQMSPMLLGMLHMPSRIFNQFWLMLGRQESGQNVAELAQLAAAIGRPVTLRILLQKTDVLKEELTKSLVNVVAQRPRLSQLDKDEMLQLIVSKAGNFIAMPQDLSPDPMQY